MILVELWNLTFENEPSRNRDSNVKFAPLGRSSAAGACRMDGARQGFVHHLRRFRAELILAGTERLMLLEAVQNSVL
jgi:hypothetical protein